MENTSKRLSFEPLFFIAWVTVGVFWVGSMWMAVDRWHSFGAERTFRFVNPSREDAARSEEIDLCRERIRFMWWGSIFYALLGTIYFLHRGCSTVLLSGAFLLCMAFMWIFQNMP